MIYYRVFKIIRCNNDKNHTGANLTGANLPVGSEPLGAKIYSDLNAAYYSIHSYYESKFCGCRCEVKEVDK